MMINKIRLLKFIDRFLASTLIKFLPSPQPRPALAHKINHVLFIRPGGIGDAVLLLPAIIALKETYPWICVDVLAEKRNAEVFKLCPQVNCVFLYDKPGGLINVVQERYDAVVDTEQWHRLSVLVANLTRAPVLIGYATNERKKLFTHQMVYSHEDFETNSFFRLLQPLSVEMPIQVRTPCYDLPVATVRKIGALLGDFADKIFIAVFPGASVQEKRWKAEKFAELIDNLAVKGMPCVIVGGNAEVVHGDKILTGGKGISMAGKTSLVETAAIISKAAVLVSGDSGLLHIAAGLGRPTVSLFGPSNIRKWAPKGEHHIVISRNLSCSPCSKFGYTPKCPINAKCMADITVDEVVAAVEKLLHLNRG